MGAPTGNRNAAKAKLWEAAIVRALRKRSATDRLEALDALAEKLLEKADEKDLSALKELGDRLDGRASQSIEVGMDTPLTEGLSRFNQLLEESIAREEAKALAGAGEERSLLPAPVSPTTH